MSGFDVGFVAVFLIAFVLGVRSTVRMWDRYNVDPERSVILLTLLLVSGFLTGVAFWIGFLSLRRLLGYPPVLWAPVVTYVIAIIVALIPAGLDWAVGRIETGRWRR